MRTYGIDANALTRTNPTGVEIYVAALVRAMMHIPLRDDEHIILYARARKPADILLPRGWEWRELAFAPRKGWTHIRLAFELLVNPPTVFFSPAHEIPVFVRRAVRVVATVHDVVFARHPETYEPKARLRQQLAVRHAIRRASRLCAVSEATKRDLVDLFRADPEAIAVTPLAPEPVVPEDNTIFFRVPVVRGAYALFVGRLEAKKNVRRLVEAFTLFASRLPFGDPFALVLCGSPGFGVDDIRRAVVQSNVRSDIHETGYVKDGELMALVANAAVLVLPSVGEGFGLPVLAAQRAGIPVIASDTPALREVAGDGALFAPVLDAAAFAECMERIVRDREFAERLVELGRVNVARYSWEQTADATLTALRSV